MGNQVRCRSFRTALRAVVSGVLSCGLLGSLVIVAGSSGCSMAAERKPVVEGRRGNFRVSVEADGKPVNNFDTPLVHRVELTHPQLQSMFIREPDKLNLPFTTKPVFDSRGKVKGIKVTGLRPGGPASALGLRENDVVTAVGKVPARRAADFWQIFRDLQQNEQGSLTVEREGKPHKVLFFKAGSEKLS